MYLLFAFAYVCIARHIPPLIPFSAINNRSTSVYGTNFIPVVFKQACYVNPGRDKKNEQVFNTQVLKYIIK